jgi:hypothetical protein
MEENNEVHDNTSRAASQRPKPSAWAPLATCGRRHAGKRVIASKIARCSKTGGGSEIYLLFVEKELTLEPIVSLNN